MLEAEADEDDYFDAVDRPFKPTAIREKIFSPKKPPTKSVYRHKWHCDDEGGDKSDDVNDRRLLKKRSSSDTQLLTTDSLTVQRQQQQQPDQSKQLSTEKVNKFFTSKLKRTVTQPTRIFEEPISQLKCRREDKEMYAVVKQVKQAHQCHEWGEAQEFSDDMEYYLSSLQGSKDNHVKYLSVSNLAQKCVSANFRAHVRAQGFAEKLFRSLSDCYTDPTLSLCTACVFYLLSRDRLSIAIDGTTLSLVLKFMDAKEPTVDQTERCDYYKYKKKIWQTLSEWHKTVVNAVGAGQSILFDVTEDNLSTSFLATEALVFVCIRAKHESFKLLMCKLGGLDLIVKQVEKVTDQLPIGNKRLDEMHLVKLKLLERYLRILEQCTHECTRNQVYLLSFNDASLLKLLVRLFEFCYSLIPCLLSADGLEPGSSGKVGNHGALQTKVLLDTLSACLKVLCNLSHLSELCCTKLSQMEGFMETCIEFVTFTIPNFIPVDDRFDLSTLALGLLVNLVEPCNLNRRSAIKATVAFKNSDSPSSSISAVEALTRLFLKHEAAAQLVDEEVDRHIESCSQEQLKGTANEVSQQIQDTLEVAVRHAGRHMEDCIISSHIALFVGLMLQQNESVASDIKQLLGDRSFAPMVAMLKKFMDFLRLINNLSNNSEKSMCTAMELLESLA